MNFKLNGSSVQTDAAVEVARVEFLGTKYDTDLKLNIEQSAEKLEVFDDIASTIEFLDGVIRSKTGFNYKLVTKAKLIEVIGEIRELIHDAEKL